jgi:hypothetical protein
MSTSTQREIFYKTAFANLYRDLVRVSKPKKTIIDDWSALIENLAKQCHYYLTNEAKKAEIEHKKKKKDEGK